MEYFITSAGIPVHINESKKDGTAILLLHGYLETLYIWNEFQDFISSEYRLISIDLPGHGLTGMPSDGFTPGFSNSFFRSLLDKLSVNQCHIITHSCGFHLASAFIRENPERVISIFNIGCPTFLSSSESSFLNSALNSIIQGSFMKFVSQFIPQMYHSSNLRACDEKIEETIQICETHETEALMAFLKGIVDFLPEQSDSLNFNGKLFNITGQSDVLFSSLPDDFCILPECGSVPFIEKPDEVAGKLELFLSGLPTKGNC